MDEHAGSRAGDRRDAPDSGATLTHAGGEMESLATDIPISPWRLALRRFGRRRPAVISVVVLAVIVVGAVFADWIAPYGEVEQNLDDILQSPNGTYLLGTDTLGRDNLSRILHGGRVSVAVAILAESTLSFLGLGVSPTRTATWGNMLGGNEGFVITAPWLVWAPGLAIVVTALCVNFVGDGLRDSLDPTQEKL